MMKEILQNLISNNSCSREKNKPLVEYITNYLEGYGFSSKLLKHDEDIFSIVSNLDLKKEKSIIFSGHLDTVVIENIEKWQTNPFELSEDDKYFYGRGVCDMKGQIATLLSAIPEMIQNLDYNIIIALSCDEESTIKSIYQITDYIKENCNLEKISHCIVMEPTENQIGISHRGGIVGNIKINGIPAHSAQPKDGVSAIKYGIKAINLLEDKMTTFYDERDLENSSLLNIGVFNSGKKFNIIPGSADITFSIRATKTHHKDILKTLEDFQNNIKVLEKDMKSLNKDCSIEISIEEIILPFLCNQDKDSISNKITGLQKSKMSYASEASVWSDMGIDTIILGAGNIQQAHTDNEYISKESLNEYKDILLKNISRKIT